jgi:hypothetical protein
MHQKCIFWADILATSVKNISPKRSKKHPALHSIWAIVVVMRRAERRLGWVGAFSIGR